MEKQREGFGSADARIGYGGGQGKVGGGVLAVSVSVLRVTYDDGHGSSRAWQGKRETYVPSFYHCHWNLIPLSPLSSGSLTPSYLSVTASYTISKPGSRLRAVLLLRQQEL